MKTQTLVTSNAVQQMSRSKHTRRLTDSEISNRALTDMRLHYDYQTIRDPRQGQSEDARSQSAFMSSSSSRSIDDRSTTIQQMFSQFVASHFPTAAARSGLVKRHSYLLLLRDIDLSNNPLVKQAASVICFAHMGAARNDTRLIHESRHRYGQVLAMLSQELQRPSPNFHPRTVILSILLLALYDDTTPTPGSGHGNWAAHYQGVQAYLAATGPSRLDMTAEVDRMLFTNIREPALWIGLAKRQDTILARKEWLDLAARDPETPRSCLIFRGIALQVPGLLERAEKMIREPRDRTGFVELCTRILDLKANLDRWFRQTWAEEKRPSLEQNVVHLTDHEDFDASIEEQLVMTTNPTFLAFYRFDDYSVADDAAKYHMIAFILGCTLLRLFHFRPDMAIRNRHDIRVDIHKDVASRARSLCKTMHALSSFADDSQGSISFMLIALRLAEGYFEETNSARERGWCQAVRLAIELRQRRCVASQPPTLCRLPRLVDSVSSLAHFRMPFPSQ